MIDRYDPLETPDPQEWRELGEDERILLVGDYHRRAMTTMTPVRQCGHSRNDSPVNASKRSR